MFGIHEHNGLYTYVTVEPSFPILPLASPSTRTNTYPLITFPVVVYSSPTFPSVVSEGAKSFPFSSTYLTTKFALFAT